MSDGAEKTEVRRQERDPEARPGTCRDSALVPRHRAQACQEETQAQETDRRRGRGVAYTARNKRRRRTAHSACENTFGPTSIIRGSRLNTDAGPHSAPRRVRYPRLFISLATCESVRSWTINS